MGSAATVTLAFLLMDWISSKSTSPHSRPKFAETTRDKTTASTGTDVTSGTKMSQKNLKGLSKTPSMNTLSLSSIFTLGEKQFPQSPTIDLSNTLNICRHLIIAIFFPF